jgi:hypothetical protein
VSIWAGANDFFGTATDPGGPVNPGVSVSNISAAIDLLAGAGVRHILVPNLPNFGAAPELAGTPGSAGASAWVQGFNALLSNELDEKRTALGISIYEPDLFTLGADISANSANTGSRTEPMPSCRILLLQPTGTASIPPTFSLVRSFFPMQVLMSGSGGELVWRRYFPIKSGHSIAAVDPLCNGCRVIRNTCLDACLRIFHRRSPKEELGRSHFLSKFACCGIRASCPTEARWSGI